MTLFQAERPLYLLFSLCQTSGDPHVFPRENCEATIPSNEINLPMNY